MKITQIRNATLIVEYAGKKILVDPMLSPKGILPPFPNPLSGDNRSNPLRELPFPANEIVEDINAVFLSHLHIDHWDDAAKEVLPKGIKIFVQDETDKKEIESSGFTNVEVLTEDTEFEGIKLSRTKAQHGRGEVLKIAGNVCGMVLKHYSEKTLYIIADSVWYEGVEEALEKHRPEVITINAGDNQFVGSGQLIMGKDDVKKIYDAVPDARLFVTHIEGVNHNTLSREELKAFLNGHNMNDRVVVPVDGESVVY
ncbi:MBL fold metallo-hydrolase [Olivibacter jilunii]|uniref:MBL fold metallo-hydrolase n=1 Tax=Olivibacter jilunii TaxID=985016 RepID=UPI003F14427F